MKTLQLTTIPALLLLLTLTSTLTGCSFKINASLTSDEQNAQSKALHALFAREWEAHLVANPLEALSMGDKRFNHLWKDVSLKTQQAQHEHQLDVLKKLNAFKPSQLSKEDQLNLRLYKWKTHQAIINYSDAWYLRPLDHRWGIQTANSVVASLPFKTVKDYEDWLNRLNTFNLYMDQTLSLMREGIKQRIVHAKAVAKRLPNQIKFHLVQSPTQSAFYKPFINMPKSISPKDQARLKTAGQSAISKVIIPAYQRMLQFMEEKYLPACNEKIGTRQLPDGIAKYARQAAYHTTTDFLPIEIHNIGLSEVKRIRTQMMKIIKEVNYTGTFDEFLTHLRTDPKFYYKDGTSLLNAYRALSKKIDPQLVKVFRTHPQIPYGVTPIPMQQAKDTTTAYYQRPSTDGSTPGQYFVNLYRPDTRPKYEMLALSLHEAVPGHHFQIALAQEIKNMPEFRKHLHPTAYIEGWALYAEWLGYEMGLYQDPYDRFGQLTYEMWRACRLVVDTGMHTMNWTRQQAIDFMLANTPKSELDITNEIDRYIAWPGQALAYKMGQLKIAELRKRAEKQLGQRFNVKAFHDVLLLDGALPLQILEEKVDAWIAQQK